MTLIQGFPPVADSDAQRLVIGSMPSRASLAAGEYYAHPRNAFWRIVAAVFALPEELDYEARCRALKAHRIALWDTLSACARTTSLDSDIVDDSIVTNDFAGFLAAHPGIREIGCNGLKSHQVFERRVRPALPDAQASIPVVRLPSTSPANASMRFETKLDRWRAFLAPGT